MRYHSCHDPNCKNRGQMHPCHSSGCLGHRFEFGEGPARQAAIEPGQRNALEIWRRHLGEIPSTFGRLAYLASLRNGETGRYHDRGLAMLLTEEQVDVAVRSAHQHVFSEWLGFDLRAQSADLDLFLSSVEGHRRQILAACAAEAPHEWLVPPGAAEHERQLYLADLSTLLELLYAEYGLTAGADPEPLAQPSDCGFNEA